jgi:hypothetical protein
MKSTPSFMSALSGAPSPSRFVAIRTDAPDGGPLLSITPKVSRWNDSIYLLDLAPVRQYWSHVAEEQSLSLTEYLSSVLKELFTSATPVTMANHPWQALLLLSITTERGALNFVDAQSHLGRRLLQDITWDQWIERCRELRDQLVSTSGKKSGKDSLGSLSSLAKTINRMQFTHIIQMADIDAPAIQRRFGKLAAMAWEWTYPSSQKKESILPRQNSLIKDESTNSLFADAFPWENIFPKDLPSVSRHIETPLRQWDHIEPLLCEDFDNICNLTCWSSHERVVSLEWVLSFSCSPSLRIPVLFRHPHALHRESGQHKTALLQAFHSWKNATASRLKAEAAGDTYIDDDSITGWTVTIEERLVITPQVQSIFRDDLSSEASQLCRLENSLPVALTRYAMTDHWTPEKSFAAFSQGTPNDNSKTISFDSVAKLAASQRRPLFIYDTPEPLADRHQSSGLIFCERVGTSWWSDNSATSTHFDGSPCRDYYIRMTDEGPLQWVFKASHSGPDASDDSPLMLHGIFG